jgi:GNAT superfamily N-acetyltransferase
MSMKITKTTALTTAQKEMICHLWNKEYPKKLAVTSTDFDVYLKSSANQTHYFILENAIDIIGWAYTFDRARERWLSIIIDKTHQRKGLGHLLLNLIKDKETHLSGWVIDHPNDVKENGDPYVSPLPFYIHHGFVAIPQTRLEDDKISAVKIQWRKA